MTRLLVLLLFAILTAASQEPWDWKRVLALREQQVRGVALPSGDQKYLEAALAALDPRANAPIATRLALAGITGDGAGEVFNAPPISISLEQAPVQTLAAQTSDGKSITASYRKPPGRGPFPAVMILHGGLDTQSLQKQSWFLTDGPVHTRLLAAGFIVLQATNRTYNRRDLLEPGPDLDVEALFLKLKSVPGVDPGSIALFGGSGGGSLALEIASRQSPAAVLVGEPATILFAGMLRTGEYEPRLRMMGDPHAYYKPENRQLMSSKLARIHAPVLLFSGDIHPLKTMNHEIFLPAARLAGVAVEWLWYHGEGHGFYFGSATSTKTVDRVVADATRFLALHLPTKARAIQQ